MKNRIARLRIISHLRFIGKAYNPLNKLVRRIKDMRTKRDIFLILFGLMLAWIVATLQSYSNPNNWEAFKLLHWSNWAMSVASVTIAGLFAYFLYRQVAKIDQDGKGDGGIKNEKNAKK